MQAAYSLLEYLKAKGTVTLDVVMSEYIQAQGNEKQRTLMLLGFFTSYEIISLESNVYTFVDDTRADELITKYLSDGKAEDIPTATRSYYQQFAFSSFVSSVAKWINHDGVIEREYDIDKLWTSPYIDFLDKCREYIAWRKSDQAILKSKISKVKASQKHGKKI
jgi:hypothetical protein